MTVEEMIRHYPGLSRPSPREPNWCEASLDEVRCKRCQGTFYWGFSVNFGGPRFCPHCGRPVAFSEYATHNVDSPSMYLLRSLHHIFSNHPEWQWSLEWRPVAHLADWAIETMANDVYWDKWDGAA